MRPSTLGLVGAVAVRPRSAPLPVRSMGDTRFPPDQRGLVTECGVIECLTPVTNGFNTECLQLCPDPKVPGAPSWQPLSALVAGVYRRVSFCWGSGEQGEGGEQAKSGSRERNKGFTLGLREWAKRSFYCLTACFLFEYMMWQGTCALFFAILARDLRPLVCQIYRGLAPRAARARDLRPLVASGSGLIVKRFIPGSRTVHVQLLSDFYH